MNKAMAMTARFFLLSTLLILGGCISLPSSGSKDKTPLSLYTLHTQSQKIDSPQPGKATGVIVVPTPEVPEGFDTEQIALYFQQGRKLDYYADAAWSGRLDDLLQDFIIQSARHGLPGKVVDTPDLDAAANYRLAVKVTDFQPVYQGKPDTAPRLDVAMTVTLIALPDETVKAHFSLKKSAVASANTLTAVTKGLQGLLRDVTGEALQKIAASMTAPEKIAVPAPRAKRH